MGMNLYELTGEILKLANMLEDPEADQDEIVAQFMDLDMMIEDKADGYAKVMKNMEATIDGIKAEEQRLKDRRTAIENRVKLLKKNLEDSMVITGKTKFKTDLFSFSIAKNPASVKIDDVSAFIDMCSKENRDDLLKFTEPTVNKKAVKDAIMKDGEVLDGVEIVQTESLRIR